MCGILVYREKGNNDYIRRRGKVENHKKVNEYTFVHSLLPVTGNLTLQPFIKDDIVCVYNGEIYNQPFEKSDGEVLIPLYQKHGILFAKQLDGEFAIALYDFKSDLALFITDPFGTKPLWRNGLECASYKSGVGGVALNPNTIEGIVISTGKVIFSYKYHNWDWNQHKETYDDWISAFEKAIKKRAKDGCFIGLSSGYDSGAISNELVKQGVKFKAYSVFNNENVSVIKKRSETVPEFEEIIPEFSKLKEELKEKVEDVFYKFSSEKLITDDIASVGLAAICKKANQEGRVVCLSGQGADEIIGDYRLYPKQSCFGGVFPLVIEEWENFTGGFQRDYLNKEEYVGGAYAIETRYPFLDTELVQEFLWLKPDLKNEFYKAPLREYLIRNNVPFNEGIKRGFRPITK